MTKQTITKFLLLVIAFTFALSANYLFAAWTGPTQAPPAGNTPTPLHVGATDQVKDAGLSLDRLAVFGNGYFSGNLGINETAPATGGEQDLNLDVEGAIGAKYYCDEDGNNCTSAPFGGGSAGHGDGSNCPAGQAPNGVDANGNVQGCFTPSGASCKVCIQTDNGVWKECTNFSSGGTTQLSLIGTMAGRSVQAISITCQ